MPVKNFHIPQIPSNTPPTTTTAAAAAVFLASAPPVLTEALTLPLAVVAVTPTVPVSISNSPPQHS